MVDLKCPTCGKLLLIPDQYRGTTGKCNGCGKPVVVPGLDAMKPVPKWKIGALNGCAVVVFVAVIVGVIGDTFFPEPPKPEPEPVSSVVQTVVDVQPTAIATPVPVPHTLESALSEALGRRDRSSAPPLRVEEFIDHILVHFAINDNWSPEGRALGAQEDTLKLLGVLHQERPGFSVTVNGTFSMVDQHGNQSEDSVLTARYSADTIARINFDDISAIAVGVWDLADSASVHRELRATPTLAPSPVAPVESAPQPLPKSTLDSFQPKSATVYITDTGKKYHIGSCRHLAKSKHEIDLDSARAQYGPCGTCNPPK